MYETIVVGTDGSTSSRGAVRHAAELAKLSGATLHLVCAYRLPSRAAMMLAAEAMYIPSVGADDDATRAAEDLLESLAGEIRADGVKVESHAIATAADEALCAVAGNEHADVIVVGNKGMKGARRVLGSVPNAVAHKASCAVLVVPTT
jgi:nucleotide-binding universal stress UspA family protein